MPAQKHPSSENRDDEEDSLQYYLKQSRHEREAEQTEEEEEEQDPEGEQDDDDDEEEDDEEDSDGSPSSTSGEKPEFVFVELQDIRKDVQCPICLGIIKKTRTVMECLHRFCRECIDKSMRMGNNECPACRTHCASRRSLRDDPNYDALIAALYPDIDKYEEEELAFHEEEKTRNKQIQDSIAQIIQRQSEALVKKRTSARILPRSQQNYRNTHPRRRRNNRGSDDNDDENDNDGGNNSSSNEEPRREVKRQRRYKKRGGGVGPSAPSSSVVNSDAGCIENDLDVSREGIKSSPGILWNTEMLAWGRGGARSHTRHGSVNGLGKNARGTRLSKLVHYLRSLEENDDETNVNVTLISLDKENSPDLEQPNLCCRPSLSVKHLCEYIALQTSLRAEDIEILVVKGQHNANEEQPILQLRELTDRNLLPQVGGSSCEDMQILEGHETLAVLECFSSKNTLILAYRQKEGNANTQQSHNQLALES